jgi:sugar phosphate isomerase/epimerase
MPLVLAAGSMLDQTPAAMIDAAAAAGFDGVGLRLSGPSTAVHVAAEWSAVRRHAAARSITVHDAEVHRIGSDDDPGPLVEQTAAVGAPALLVVSDTMIRAETVAGVAALVELARPHGVRIALEYMAWTDPAGPRDAVAIARETGCQVVVDLLHHVRVGAGVADLQAVVESGTLGWVQVCDAVSMPPDDLLHEARHQRLVPGAGALPLRELLACVGEEVTISVEVQSDTLSTLDPFARARLLHDAARSLLSDR